MVSRSFVLLPSSSTVIELRPKRLVLDAVLYVFVRWLSLPTLEPRPTMRINSIKMVVFRIVVKFEKCSIW
jgi:hypothetical protein